MSAQAPDTPLRYAVIVVSAIDEKVDDDAPIRVAMLFYRY